MGREIRRVPKNWEHPRDENGRYIPLHDETYDEAAEEWITEFIKWEKSENPDREEYDTRYYWDWSGEPPSEISYRQPFDTEPDCYQIYETVSEGTPASPVFSSKEEMIEWLIAKGYSKNTAENFAKAEWAPSMILTAGRLLSGIAACEEFKK